MADILLTSFNARYAHTSFGARYLLANMGDLQHETELVEFDLQVQPRIAVEKILEKQPKIVSIGCYIWNIELATKTAALLKSIRPDIHLMLGGPEISYETEQQEIFQYADLVICGEGEIEFPKHCRSLLEAGDTAVSSTSPSPAKIIHATPVDITQINLPYDLYSDNDIKHRAIYVEASRGCPFRCEYCMSSLDLKVRYFPEDQLFAAFQKLLDRGALNFKFVDRTFNIDIPFALKILNFFKKQYQPGMMLHFEVIPDHLPDELFEAVKNCPPGMLQFEIGIQTFNEEVAHRIQRPLNIKKIETNMQRLSTQTGVHIHSDLIAGLPGEDLTSFESGFNRLLALGPQEIQLGILKRLRGAPIDRHTKKWNMIYSPHAPYEILSTNQISFNEMQRIQRFARYWNLIVNNGQFIETAPLIWLPIPAEAQGLQNAGDTSRGRQDVGDTTASPGPAAVPPASSRPSSPATVSPASSRPSSQATVPPASSRPSSQATVPPASSGPSSHAIVSPASSRLPESTGFNPHQEIHQTRRKNYPHWTQDGSTYFVTFRLADSIPQSRIKEYDELRRKWEEHHKPPYSTKERKHFNELFSEQINEWLDAGAGSCCLKNPELSAIVAQTLLHFNGERYELDEWVIMPNHVHVLVKPFEGYELADIIHSWKSYSSNTINRKLERTGSLWKKEYYDHIVRDIDELIRIRKYINNNPAKAGIRVPHSSSLQDADDTSQGRQGVGDTPVPPASSRLPDQTTVSPASSRLPDQATVPPASCGPSSQATVPPASSRLPDQATVPPASCGPSSQTTVSPASCGPEDSAFAAFMHWSNWLYAKTDSTGNLHMVRLAKLLLNYLTEERGLDEKTVAQALWHDYQRGNRPDVPGFLKKFGFHQNCDSTDKTPRKIGKATEQQASRLPRQARHLKD